MKSLANSFEYARFTESRNTEALEGRVTKVKNLADSCHELCRDHPANLVREAKPVRDLRDGIRVTMSYKQPQLVALHVYNAVGFTVLRQSAADKDAMNMGVVDHIKPVNGKSGFEEFAGWNRNGSVTSRALHNPRPHHRGYGGGQYREQQLFRPPTAARVVERSPEAARRRTLRRPRLHGRCSTARLDAPAPTRNASVVSSLGTSARPA